MLLVDRMHRVPWPRHLPDTAPKDVLLRAHYYHIKEHILRASRNKVKPPEEYPMVKLFTDLSSATLRRRRDFALIAQTLRSNGIRYCWGFPVKMLINREGKMISITSPEDGLSQMRWWGLENLPDEQAATQPKRLLLDWHKTPHRR
ncbi:Hypothetical predicted protein [Pelobates cultripes]|uniref:Uncharacterized protein n=1 Tax=Pelobates cultripes TaxID=61616 RepID=A0AAD1WQ00_PELCU|nr:Hypothetical predicted protein [Pelobates cultripes]